jgi:hypothetical protein
MLCFLITAPVVTLWSHGYRLDWQNKSLTQVGGLYINLRGLPRDSKLTIENIGSRVLTPPLLAESYLWRNILPGAYEIKISKEGYISWLKSAIVQPLQVTKFTSALLFPETPVIEPLGGIKASDFWLSGRSADSIYFSDKTGRQLFFFERNREGAEPQQLIGPEAELPFLRSRILEAKPSPDDSALLIRLANELIIFKRDKSELMSLMPYVRQMGLGVRNFTSLFWNPVSPAELVVIVREKIYLIDIGGSTYRRILEDDPLLAHDRAGAALLGASGNLYRFTRNENRIEKFDRIALVQPQNKTVSRIGMLAGRRYLLLDNNGNLWKAQSNAEPNLVSRNILDFWISPGASRIAVFSKDQVLSVYFSEKHQGDVIYLPGTILRLGLLEKKPADVFWMRYNWHLLLRFPEKMEIIEIDSRPPINRVSYPIISTDAVWRQWENTLFYLAQNSFWIWRLP